MNKICPELNDIVAIHQDPITRQDYEGIARLIRPVRLDVEDYALSIWLVEFIGEEGELYQRTINSQDIKLELRT